MLYITFILVSSEVDQSERNEIYRFLSYKNL